jgi:hypothetical protein
VKTQEEMGHAQKELESTYAHRFQENMRKYAFLTRWYWNRFIFKWYLGKEKAYKIKESLQIGILSYQDSKRNSRWKKLRSWAQKWFLWVTSSTN